MEARILESDSIPEDNRALLEIPELKSIKVAVYSDDPDTLRPALQCASADRADFLPDERRIVRM